MGKTPPEHLVAVGTIVIYNQCVPRCSIVILPMFGHRLHKRGQYKLTDPDVAEMLEMYSNGMPRYIVSEEYNIHQSTLRRLIKEYEAIHGNNSLRTRKVMRYSDEI